jgi:IS5 family transposase
MLRLDNRQQDLLSAMLPAEVLRLPPELAEVDRMLDDPQVLAPLAGRLCLDRGRPSLPVAQVLRLFYLKERYQLSDRGLSRFFEVGEAGGVEQRVGCARGGLNTGSGGF